MFGSFVSMSEVGRLAPIGVVIPVAGLAFEAFARHLNVKRGARC